MSFLTGLFELVKKIGDESRDNKLTISRDVSYWGTKTLWSMLETKCLLFSLIKARML